MPKRNTRSSSGSRKRASVPQRRAEDESAYDSDQAPTPSDLTLVSSWRLDPEESLSDWTIEIVVNGQPNATYHVHKQNLVVGPRKSDYFVKLFAEGGRQFAEAENCTSRIELEELAAGYFPQILDYLYLPERKLSFDTNNAAALYSMAKYFGIRLLRYEAKQFWQVDIKKASTCGVYYEHGRLLHEDKILEVATSACAENIMSMSIPKPRAWYMFQNPTSGSRFCSRTKTPLENIASMSAH